MTAVVVGGGTPRVVMVAEGAALRGEDLAKLQAMYSRSDASVLDHVAKVESGNSSAFMETYFLGYGHSSIADCATALVFVEGVSHVAAKAIQDHPLYNGTEMSTRYVDCARRPLVDAGPDAAAAQAAWLEAYGLAYAAKREDLEASVPREGSERVRANAIHARACDVARGFLPVSSTTNLSWTTTLRQFGDRLAALAHHPLEEVRGVAGTVLAALAERFPGSFRLQDYPSRSEFYAGCALPLHYATAAEALAGHGDLGPGRTSVRVEVDHRLMEALPAALWRGRPAKTPLPRAAAAGARTSLATMIDYGSFRDLQRHRAGLCRIPLIEGPVSIHPWYPAQLPERVRGAVGRAVAAATAAVDAARAASDGSDDARAKLQYAYPLGQVVPARMDCDLAQSVYVVEMRTSRHVHATLRAPMAEAANALRRALPGIPVHVDDFPIDGFDVARGTHTVTVREDA